MKKKKILITGSSGFVGNNLKKHLEKKYKVYGIGRKKLNQKNYFNLNIKNKKKINSFFQKNKFEIVIHLRGILIIKITENLKLIIII